MSIETLAGRVAIVTGGTHGIGLSIAEALLTRGASVAVSGRDAGRLALARERLAALGPAEAIQADVRRPEEVEGMVGRTVEVFGRLDVLVNNAGLGRFASLTDLSIEQWHEVIETNLSGVFYACRAAIPHLKRQGSGWIVNISSLAARNAFAGGTAYCASKAGLNALSEALMQEVRHDGIRVSCVMPGSVRTGFSSPAGDDAWKLEASDVAQVVVDLLGHDRRSLPSRVEIRPSRPPRKS